MQVIGNHLMNISVSKCEIKRMRGKEYYTVKFIYVHIFIGATISFISCTRGILGRAS